MPPIPDSDELRAAAFAFLDRLIAEKGPYLRRSEINGFTFQGEVVPLMEQGGIRMPSRWAEALSITSTNRTAEAGGYDDEDLADGQRLYRYMRRDSSAAPAKNSSLDNLVRSGRPLIYFVEVDRSLFEPLFPVFLAGSEAGVGVIVSESPARGEYADLIDLRRYATRRQRVRLHQQEFRSRVLYAYEDRCCICSLKHRGLLDAAHIVDDAHEEGLATVTNGLSLCRIHHGAYDQFLLGIDPDLRVEVNGAILGEVDGPMLRHGLQDMHGASIRLPRKRAHHPDRERLAWKYERFRAQVS
ncbi:MAG: HNH endonuclease [Nitriliruptor sp.]